MRLITMLLCVYIVLNSCSPINTNRYVDSEFRRYVDRFNEYAQDYGVKVDTSNVGIMFMNKTDNKSVVGSCYKLGYIRIITIDEVFWRYASPLERELVLFHELGHCVLNRDHCRYSSLSIMYPYLISVRDYAVLRSSYLKELFLNPFREQCKVTE